MREPEALKGFFATFPSLIHYTNATIAKPARPRPWIVGTVNEDPFSDLPYYVLCSNLVRSLPEP